MSHSITYFIFQSWRCYLNDVQLPETQIFRVCCPVQLWLKVWLDIHLFSTIQPSSCFYDSLTYGASNNTKCVLYIWSQRCHCGLKNVWITFPPVVLRLAWPFGSAGLNNGQTLDGRALSMAGSQAINIYTAARLRGQRWTGTGAQHLMQSPKKTRHLYITSGTHTHTHTHTHLNGWSECRHGDVHGISKSEQVREADCPLHCVASLPAVDEEWIIRCILSQITHNNIEDIVSTCFIFCGVF